MNLYSNCKILSPVLVNKFINGLEDGAVYLQQAY